MIFPIARSFNFEFFLVIPLGTANGSLSAYSRSQKCSTTNSTAEGILTSKPDSQPKDSSLMSSKSNINQTGEFLFTSIDQKKREVHIHEIFLQFLIFEQV